MTQSFIQLRTTIPVRSVTARVVIAICVCAITFSQPSISRGQPSKPKTTGKPTVDAFAESAVDRIAAKIREDLKGLEPSVPTETSTPKKPKTPKESSVADSSEGTSKSTGAVIKTFKSAKVKAVEANIQKCLRADEAVVLYLIFLADPATSDEDRQEAVPRLQFWEQAAIDKLVRVGPKWLSREEADKLRSAADKLVAEALELLNVDNFAGANMKLELAAKVYPEHLESLFLLAVSAFLNREFKQAETKFSACLSRAPNYVPLLNNAALAEAQMKKYDKAVKYWERAADVDPENETIAQNLGQFISDASTKKIPNVDKRVISDASVCYQIMVSKDPKLRSNAARGYVLTRQFRTTTDSASPEENQAAAIGTGFVIADGFVLTNRRIADDAEALVIRDPAKAEGTALPAKLLGVAKELDLALIECRGLKAAPVHVNTVPLRRGAEVMAIGNPTTDLLGMGLKSTRGTIADAPSDSPDKMIVLDTAMSPGFAGGPLCDKAGRVVGVISARNSTTGFSQTSGLVLPIDDAMPFVKQYIRDYSPPKSNLQAVPWAEVDALVSPSTVLILVQKKR